MDVGPDVHLRGVCFRWNPEFMAVLPDRQGEGEAEGGPLWRIQGKSGSGKNSVAFAQYQENGFPLVHLVFIPKHRLLEWRKKQLMPDTIPCT